MCDCGLASSVETTVFAAGGYLVKDDNRRILKLCLAMRRRQWFEGLWGKSKEFDLPVSFTSHL
jgi:hypothetical protein